MVIFHSYVSLPEGKWGSDSRKDGKWSTQNGDFLSWRSGLMIQTGRSKQLWWLSKKKRYWRRQIKATTYDYMIIYIHIYVRMLHQLDIWLCRDLFLPGVSRRWTKQIILHIPNHPSTFLFFFSGKRNSSCTCLGRSSLDADGLSSRDDGSWIGVPLGKSLHNYGIYGTSPCY